MEINVSKFAGFCDGVRRAYEIVENLDLNKTKNPVCILGSLAHNEDVAKKVEQKGIKKIDLEYFLNSKIGEIGTLIITAHGMGPSIFEIAKKKNINIIDTTCPKVIKVQRLAQIFSKRGYEIALIGDRDHKEVEGIKEWGKGKAKIVSSLDDLENIDFSKNDKIVVLSQTTQDGEFFKTVADFLKNTFPNVEVISTICDATHNRQEEVKKIALASEKIKKYIEDKEIKKFIFIKGRLISIVV